ncbi:alpha/beta hydrolase fold-domain-containing protein [Jackrogersella minutella]|nr:alpha/beta hydrolase fold-domain-containing protein [Jackrogersella minutella]
MSSSTNADKAVSGTRLLGLFSAILPQIPLIAKVILLHILSMSESSKYLDLKSDVIISVLRSMTNPGKPLSIAEGQAMSTRDPGIKGKIWISKVMSKVPPEQGIRDALLAAIDRLRDSTARGTEPSFKIPDIVPVEAEWTGFRAAATKNSTLPAISEEEKYRELMKETTNPTTILYFHGGAYYLCDPATHRLLVKTLAKLTGGRAYSVRYRLAPQGAFPSALLDALVSYFTLLYPPPGSFHEAVAPKDLVLAGDSAGGNLTLALLRTLLEIRRQNLKIAWFGEEREVPLPAGVSTLSPWLDLLQTMPSLMKNQKWCYLPPPTILAENPAKDAVWPTNPPRRHVYIDDAYLLHPLGSLQMIESWEGAPPVYVSCGWETLADEDKYLVSKLTRDGVTVVFEEYEAMPHVWAAVLPKLTETQHNLNSIAKFIKAVCDDPNKVQSSYKTIKAKTLKESDILDIANISPYTDEQAQDMARQRVSGLKPTVPPGSKS